ncbi:hypothetical protein [Caniella muris]|uniref:hypothetical protein n=1 Tax=Caniella muris TaxID=2941502 RepID=UPI00203F052D|nr:hypothetical protein [Caniella muris]
MKARDFSVDSSDIAYEARLALDQMDAEEEVSAEALVKSLFAALKCARTNQRRLDSLLLASEGELPERIRGLGIDCSDDEVHELVDQFGRSYCW